MCQSFSSSISQSVYTQHLDWFQIIPRNDCYLLIDYHENLDDDDDFDNDYENFENDYEDFVCDVLDDHNDIDDHDDIDDHYDVDGHDNADDHYGENISLALNVLPCFKERLQFLNIRVKSQQLLPCIHLSVLLLGINVSLFSLKTNLSVYTLMK